VSGFEQGPLTRNILARLDLSIIDLESQERGAREVAEQAHRVAEQSATRRAELMRIRDELRPLLDSRAPRAYPYDDAKAVHAAPVLLDVPANKDTDE
jgi:hypothetical protein